jgi:transcriptional regulator with XRE-family HTH domain
MSAQKSHLTPPGIFGQRLRELRESRGWTQGELGKRAGFDRTTINKIENGSRSDVAISQLFTFAEVLGTSPIYLLTPSDPGLTVQLSPGGRVLSGAEARDWIRGAPPPGADRWTHFQTMPDEELQKIAAQTAGGDNDVLDQLAAVLTLGARTAKKGN